MSGEEPPQASPGAARETTSQPPGEDATRPVTPEALFQIVAEEAFKDGVLEGWEAKILQILARFLGLGRDRAIEIALQAKRQHAEGRLGEARPLRPGTLYRKVLYFVCADGTITETEGQMLLALRRLFKISEDEHARHLHQVAMQFRRRDASRPPEAPAAEAPPPALPRDPVATRLLDAARAAAAAEAAGGEARHDPLELYQQLRGALEERRQDPAALLEAFAHLTPLLAARERSKDVTAFLADTVQPRDLWAGVPELYLQVIDAWSGRLTAQEDQGRGRGLVETCWRLAQLEPAGEHRWTGMGRALFHVLRDLASRRAWSAHAGLVGHFRRVPDSGLAAVAGPWSEAAADWVVLGLHDGQLFAVDRGLHELKLLASYRDQPTVRRSEAAALGCVIQSCADEGATEERPLLAALGRYLDLLAAFPDDPELARPLVVASQTAGRTLVRLGHAEACIDLVDQLSRVAGTHAHEQELAADLARALLGTAMARARQSGPGPGDPVRTALESAMTRLAARCPESPLVLQAQQRLETVFQPEGIS